MGVFNITNIKGQVINSLDRATTLVNQQVANNVLNKAKLQEIENAIDSNVGIDNIPQEKSGISEIIPSIETKTFAVNNIDSDALVWFDKEATDVPTGLYEETEDNSNFGEPVLADSGKKGKDGKPIPKLAKVEDLNHSRINDYHLIRLKSPLSQNGSNSSNYPLLETEFTGELFSKIKNATVKDLIKNNTTSMQYKALDFVYSSRHGQLPINKLITLRRYAFPTFDDMSSSKDMDIARMITYSDDNINPINSIIKMDWGLRWKQLNAQAQTVGMNGSEEGTNSFMNTIMKILDPNSGENAMLGANRLNVNPMYDNNKVYGPVDAITETHIRDIGLNYTFPIQLRFDYTLRSINGVSPKAAFIDIISNILACTMNNGKFWGGARMWMGPKQNSMRQRMKFMQAKDWTEFLSGGMEDIKGMLKYFSDNSPLKILESIAMNMMNLMFGAIMDKVGRPSLVLMDSLLKNNPLGEWHLTIGNPWNPILCMGNMIIKNTSFQFDENSFGYEDFPTKFSVTIDLESHMPRDKAGIESIFNAGKGRTYWKPKEVYNPNRTMGNRAKTSRMSANSGGGYDPVFPNLKGAASDIKAAINYSNNVIYDFYNDVSELSKQDGKIKPRAQQSTMTSTSQHPSTGSAAPADIKETAKSAANGAYFPGKN